MKPSLFFIFLLMYHFGQAADEKLSPYTSGDIVKRALEVMEVDRFAAQDRTAIAGEYDNQTAMANPQFNMGFGRVKNSLGLAAGYREWGVSQSFSVSGAKNRLGEKKHLALEYSGLNHEQKKLAVAERALVLSYEYKAEQEKAHHVQERLERLKKLKAYLSAKKFPSPQQKVELEFIKAKINEVSLEVEFIGKDVETAQTKLMRILDLSSPPTLVLTWKSLGELSKMLDQFDASESFQEKRLKNEVEQIAKEKSIKSVQWVPDVNLYYSQSEEQYAGGNFNQTVGVNLAIPLFNLGQSSRKSLQAQKNIKTIAYQREKKDLAIQKDQVLGLLKKCLLVLDRYTDRHIDEKEKALTRATESFDRGLITASQFIDFEDQVHSIHAVRLDYLLRSHALILQLNRDWGSQKTLKEFL